MTVTKWSPALPAILAGPHRATWRVTAHHPDLPDEGEVLTVSRVQLSYDESRAPRVNLTLDVAKPADPALDALLDPRTGIRVHVHAGHIINGVDDRILIADLGLRRRSEEDPSGTTQLDASSDEALVVDAAPSSPLSSRSSDTPRGHIQYLIGLCMPSPEYGVVDAPTGTAMALPVGTIGDKWALIEDLADGIGDVDVFDDGLRVWHITTRPTLAADPDLELEDGVGGTVVSTSSTVDREADWYNRVILVHRWTVSGTESVIVGVRSITTGPFAAVAGNIRAWTEERTTPATQTRADTAAASLVRRKASRGRNLTVRAVAVPWLRPGMTVALTVRTGTARHLVSSVTFDGAGWMEFTTRYPDSTETIG